MRRYSKQCSNKVSVTCCYRVLPSDKILLHIQTQLGLTQAEFAEKIGLTATTISRYETGLIKTPKYMDFVLEALESRLVKKLQLPNDRG